MKKQFLILSTTTILIFTTLFFAFCTKEDTDTTGGMTISNIKTD